MIAIVDTNRTVRHKCFRILTSECLPVQVFYSTLWFVDSGALYDADLLILGETRDCKNKCSSLRWASIVRPDLKTVLLDSITPCIRPLYEVCCDPRRLSKGYECESLNALQIAEYLELLLPWVASKYLQVDVEMMLS